MCKRNWLYAACPAVSHATHWQVKTPVKTPSILKILLSNVLEINFKIPQIRKILRKITKFRKTNYYKIERIFKNFRKECRKSVEFQNKFRKRLKVKTSN